MATLKEMDARLAEFGKRIGQPEVHLDEFGLGALWFDERIEVDLEFDENTDQLILECDLGAAPTERVEPLYREALRFNAGWPLAQSSVVILDSEDSENETLCLRARHPSAGLEGKVLEGAIAEFTRLADAWRTYVREGAGEGGEVPSVAVLANPDKR